MDYNFKKYFKKRKILKLNNKPIFKYFLKKKFKLNNFFLRKKYIYYTIYWKKNLDFLKSARFITYSNNLNILKKKFNTIKYQKIIDVLRERNYKNKIFCEKFYLKKKKIRLNQILNYIYIYNLFFYSIYLDIFHLNKFLKKKDRIIYFLILSFKKNKLFINLQNINKKTYCSISTGLFIKFFDKRKSIKKNKTIKLLMAKYIRKLLLISKIKNLILVIKKIPLFLNELINLFNLPIVHKFLNPVDGKIIEEEDNNFLQIKFLYFLFLENKNFSKNKNPQKGRIKRKILRKIIFENKIVD